MTGPSRSGPIDEAQIPIFYRLFFLYIEPVSALVGAYFAFFDQAFYLALTHSPSAPSGPIPASTQIVLSQLSNLYFFFAMNEALVLRSTKDLRVWKTLLFGLLIADLGHLWSVKAVGWDIYWRVENWNAIDWGNIGFVYAGAAMRSSFLLGFGMKPSKEIVVKSEKIEDKQIDDSKIKYGASRLFNGLEISLTGFEDFYYRDELGDLIMSHGGRYRGALHKDYSTHLIAKDAVGPKYEAARKWGVEIVNVDWLRRSIEENKVLEGHSFRVSTVDESR